MAAFRVRAWHVILIALVVQVTALRAEGHRWWCVCGQPNLWSSDAHGSHNSQHLLDPYSFSHVSHGILLYGLLWLVARRVPVKWRFCLAVGVEIGWEVVENSDVIIDRFRATALAAGYRGDSVANSVGDVLSCMVGFALARWLGLWWSLGLVVLLEGGLYFWIGDNLLLDVITLIQPIN
jgi:Protein of unknown function (DUF2585)